VTILEATASSLLTESGKVVGVTCSFKDSEKSLEIHAPMTFIADGCFSKFRRDLIDRPIEVPGHFVG
jgi:squalene monooxygenase